MGEKSESKNRQQWGAVNSLLQNPQRRQKARFSTWDDRQNHRQDTGKSREGNLVRGVEKTKRARDKSRGENETPVKSKKLRTSDEKGGGGSSGGGRDIHKKKK